jgi:hypothetical protein
MVVSTPRVVEVAQAASVPLKTRKEQSSVFFMARSVWVMGWRKI